MGLQEECKTCIAGKYQDQDNAASIASEGWAGYYDCRDCPTGRFIVSTPIGTNNRHFAHREISDCLFCDKGKYFIDKVTACSVCTVGKYNDLGSTAGVACKTCPTGRSTLLSDSNPSDYTDVS